MEPLHHEGLAGGALPVELGEEPALTQDLRLLDDVLDEAICELLVQGVEAGLQRIQKGIWGGEVILRGRDIASARACNLGKQ